MRFQARLFSSGICDHARLLLKLSPRMFFHMLGLISKQKGFATKKSPQNDTSSQTNVTKGINDEHKQTSKGVPVMSPKPKFKGM